MPSPSSPTPAEQAIGKLVTDAVATVIDERRQAAIDPNVRSVVDAFAARLATQFHNVPGFVLADFEARANASDIAKAAAVVAADAAKKAKATQASASAASAAPVKFDAAARQRELIAAQAAAAHE